MAILTWGQAGTKFYETGVDRVVFYPMVGPGVAWTGVTSITEKNDGGDLSPYYLDGLKLIDFVENVDFKLELSAFGTPPEFRVCEGLFELHKGFIVTQQPRKFFGLSYRTLLSNDLGAAYYRIHLVYNLFSNSNGKKYTSLTKSTDPIEYSWTMDSIPVANTTKKPTAHISVNSKSYTAAKITALENLLYGTVSTDPTLPTQAVVRTTLGV